MHNFHQRFVHFNLCEQQVHDISRVDYNFHAHALQLVPVEEDRYLVKGQLWNGPTFYVYKLLLYTEEFNPRCLLFRMSFEGGCYLQRNGLSNQRMRSLSSMTAVSITRNEVSTNSIFQFMIAEIVVASTGGMETCNP